MSRLTTLLHDPATMISIGVGFLILAIFILAILIRSKIKGSQHSTPGLVPDPSPAVAPMAPPSGSDNSLAFLEEDREPPASATVVPLYNALAFTDDGIKFKTIKERLLTQIFCDPSLPKPGARYLCVEKNGVVKAYDPRDSIISSLDTAQRAWRATHCYDIVKAMFATPLTGLEKLNQVFMWVFCGGLLFLGIIALSRL
jgi:hypothetical protein